MKKEIEFYVPHGYKLVGDIPRSTMCDNETLLVRYDIKPIDKPDPQQLNRHAELKSQYVRDLETCATIDGLDAYQLWQGERFNGNFVNLTLPPKFYVDVYYRRHPHADSMIEYYQCSDDDKLRWQCRYNDGQIAEARWKDLKDEKPLWHETDEFRLKPRTITINGKEYNAPLNVAPAVGTTFYFFEVDAVISEEWGNDPVQFFYLKTNHCFTNREDCKAVADAFAEILASAK
ncbi:MAG: hypothetical protein RL755_25 [Pseudomonadota bacterium]|jgi:hypothetical protein